VYDASTSATALLIKGSAALSGVETDDVVTLNHGDATATFATKNVDTAKVITIVGITISGTDYLNYSLSQPTTSANITAKTLTVTGITANNRVYNASTSATALLNNNTAARAGVETHDHIQAALAYLAQGVAAHRACERQHQEDQAQDTCQRAHGSTPRAIPGKEPPLHALGNQDAPRAQAHACGHPRHRNGDRHSSEPPQRPRLLPIKAQEGQAEDAHHGNDLHTVRQARNAKACSSKAGNNHRR
jgi:hypothetical protein